MLQKVLLDTHSCRPAEAARCMQSLQLYSVPLLGTSGPQHKRKGRPSTTTCLKGSYAQIRASPLSAHMPRRLAAAALLPEAWPPCLMLGHTCAAAYRLVRKIRKTIASLSCARLRGLIREKADLGTVFHRNHAHGSWPRVARAAELCTGSEQTPSTCGYAPAPPAHSSYTRPPPSPQQCTRLQA